MSGKKKLLMALLVLVLLGSVAAGLCWNLENYVLVELKLYPKTQQLDLRGEEISVKHYEKLRQRLPDCEILWNVPFQGQAVPNNVEELAVETLSFQDIQTIACFPKLKTLKAADCTDYENLLNLALSRPDLRVEYEVRLGDEKFAGTAKKISLGTVVPEEISRLAYLPQLETVLCGGGAPEDIALLQEYCVQQGLEFRVLLGDEMISPDTREVTASHVTDRQMGILEFLPELTSVHLSNPEASQEKLQALQTARPEVEITWEQELYGTVYPSDTKKLDLSGAKVSDLKELKEKMAYFPEVETVFLGACGLDNELLAEHRNQVRDQYKLVWTVTLGNKLKSRTDAKTFMPVREYVYYFNDEEAYNLRYCEEMVCIDIGHMSIHNIDFVEFMPDLEYLILAHTQLNYIEPIRHCKKLKFLELDWSPLRDLTPLKECTALEDLNLGNTFADFTPIGEMTWLKNLWMIDCSSGARYQMTQALPDTKVMITGAATVANGWRKLENYYEMRDLLGMHYMSW